MDGIQASITNPNDRPLPCPLLTTKLHLPRVRSTLVSRPRLIERLNEGLNRAPNVTLISAPAGSGKTTLVVEWSRRAECPIAWFSLDKDDNDPTRFLTYVIAALDILKTGMGQHGLALLRSPRPPSVEAVLTVLINDLVTFPHPITLVLDDYHLIEDGSIHAGLAFLLEHLPWQLHLILTSRVDPPLPLARLQGRNQLIELRADDLRFTPEEGTTFLNQVMELNLSVDDIAALEARTEGWIAGMQFAALSMQRIQEGDDRRYFIQALTGRDRQIVDYLLAEVLQRQRPEVQHFLLHTAILERMNSELCETVVGQGQGQVMLEALERANLFIVPLDNERCWYRYHHLFADLLRQRLQQMVGAKGIASLHDRASRWYEAQGLIDEAINHALAGEAFDRAAQLMEPLAAKILWGRGAVIKLRRWLAVLPPDTLRQHPGLCLSGAWSHLLAYDPPSAEKYLQTASQTSNLSDEILGEMAAIQAITLRSQDDLSQALKYLHQALRQVPEDNLDVLGMINLQLGWASQEQGDLASTNQLMMKVVDMAQTTNNVYLTVQAMFTLGQIAFSQAQLYRAAKIYQETLQLAADQGGQALPPAGLAHFGLGDIFYQWNELEKAGEHYEAGVTLGEQAGIGEILSNGYARQAYLWQRQGDVGGVKQLLQKLRQLARSLNLPRVMAQQARFEADIALRQGDLATVARWVKTNGLSTSDEPDKLQEDYWLLVRFLLAQYRVQGDLSPLTDAVALLRRLLGMADSMGFINAAITLRILQALTYQAQNKLDQALTTLKQALTLARSEGYVRAFLDEGPPMAALLQQALKCGLMPGYTRELLTAFRAEGQKYPASPLNVEPLTEREIQVLQQIAVGLSSQEIAAELVISVNTVRAHIRSIYSKLNAHSRVQTVELARQLGILSGFSPTLREFNPPK